MSTTLNFWDIEGTEYSVPPELVQFRHKDDKVTFRVGEWHGEVDATSWNMVCTMHAHAMVWTDTHESMAVPRGTKKK